MAQNLSLVDSKQSPLKKKISIVMGYYNRRHQLEFTLKTILKSSYKNIEIIITDDASQPSETINDFVDKYKIKLIRIEPNQKTWVNPAVAYNKAIEQASGEIIIIQNPEVCHLDDICQYVSDHLKYNDYFSFSCFGLANDDATKRIRTLIENGQSRNIINEFINVDKISGNTLMKDVISGWLNHKIHLPVGYHYLSALHKNKLIEIGGFDRDYEKGLCHDDDDFIRKIVRNQMNIVIVEKYCIHQYHSNFNRSINFLDLWKRNQKHFWNKMLSYNFPEDFHVVFSELGKVYEFGFHLPNYLNKNDWIEKIPKILHLYWNGQGLKVLHYLTVQTFLFYNPDWEVNIYIPINGRIIGHLSESKFINKNYYEHLKKMRVNIITINFESIGFTNEANDFHKSDYLKWYSLYNYGGVWSNFDIIYIKKMTKMIFQNSLYSNCSIDNLEVGLFYFGGSYQTGFLLASPKKDILRCCLDSVKKYYNKQTSQSIGSIMLGSVLGSVSNLLSKYQNVCILNIQVIYPYGCNQLSEFFNANQLITNLINSQTIGVDWSTCSEADKNFCLDSVDLASNILKKDSVVCQLLKRYEIQKYKRKFIQFSDYDFIPFYQLNDSENLLSKSITELHNLATQRKVIGFNSDGSICEKMELQIRPQVNLLNEFSGCYIKSPKYPKISIVMNYYNLKKQLLLTLETIERSQYKNIEVIIIDESSDSSERLEEIVDRYSFIIKLKRIESCHYYLDNVCIENIGIELATGLIVVLQQPGCFHIGDILSYIAHNLSENDYLSFSCLSSPNLLGNESLSEYIRKNPMIDARQIIAYAANLKGRQVPFWYNHPIHNNKCYSYCATTYRSNLCKVRGFCGEYKNNYICQQEDLLLRLKSDLKLQMKTVSHDQYVVVHQYHQLNFGFNKLILEKNSSLQKLNEKIYESKRLYRSKFSSSFASQIPHIFHCYVEDSPLSYLKYLSIRSFNYYNPHWDIKICTSLNRQFSDSECLNYWKELKTLPNLQILPIDFNQIGFYNNANDMAKSIYLRWYLLSKFGGLWSDLDIIYINSIENKLFKEDSNFNTLIYNIENRYYALGFLMANPGNRLFTKLMNSTKLTYDENHSAIGSIGTSLMKKLWPTSAKLLSEFSDLKIKIGDKNTYLQYECTELNKIYKFNHFNEISAQAVGIYIFKDSKEALIYENNLTSLINDNLTISLIIKKFQKILKNDYLYKPIEYIKP